MTCRVVVPCYNEANRFPVGAFREYLGGTFGNTYGISFVLVNDGSSDATISLLEDLRREFPDRIEVLDKKRNGGKGEAVRDGVLFALQGSPTGAPEIVGFWDADLATPLEAISQLMQPLIENPAVQMVFGSRVQLMGRHIERKPSRHYLGRVFATTVSALLKLAIYDTQCGAKLFRANPEIAGLFSEPFSTRWVFDVEILARFIKARQGDMKSIQGAIYEFPLHAWRDIGGSKVKPQDFIRAFVDVLGIYRKYRL